MTRKVINQTIWFASPLYIVHTHGRPQWDPVTRRAESWGIYCASHVHQKYSLRRRRRLMWLWVESIWRRVDCILYLVHKAHVSANLMTPQSNGANLPLMIRREELRISGVVAIAIHKVMIPKSRLEGRLKGDRVSLIDAKRSRTPLNKSSLQFAFMIQFRCRAAAEMDHRRVI